MSEANLQLKQKGLTASKGSLSRMRGSSIRLDDHRVEIEMMKRDIAEKDSQISHMNARFEKLTVLTRDIWNLILELETATSEEFITQEQREAESIPSPHELVSILRRSLTRLIKLHDELPQRFEQDFSTKVEKILAEISEKRNEIDIMKQRRANAEKSTAKLKRRAEMNRIETESLAAMSEQLKTQKEEEDESHSAEAANLKDQISTMKQQLRDMKATVRAKKLRNDKANDEILVPTPKRILDAVKEDVALNRDIAELEKRLEKETQDHNLSMQELEFTYEEIKRAEEMLAKYKGNLRKEKKREADDTNDQLRDDIEKVRAEYRRAKNNHKKRNIELEKQKADLIEEEKMLTTFLQSLEKQLQAQMQKLPSLVHLHKRSESVIQQRRSPTLKAKKAPDDAEMRMIKKAIAQMKSRRVVSKSVLVAPRYHQM